MADWTPEGLWACLGRLGRPQRWAFAGAWAAGLLAHGYMFVNKLPNHDDTACFWNKGGSTGWGRWALDLMARLDGGFSSPWMLGLLSLLFLSAAAMLLVGLLELQSPSLSALAGAVFTVFPTVTSAFSYMFTCDAYMLSVLLAILSARLAARGGWARLGAAGCLILSLGLYQGFLGWAVALMIYTLLLRCLAEGASFRPIFLDGLWDLGVLAGGVAGYIGLTRVIWAVTDSGPVDYQGIDQMGRVNLPALPGQMWDAWRLFYNVFRSPSLGACTTPGLRFLLTACQWLAVGLIGARAVRHFRAGRRLEAALAALLGLALPVGIGIVYLMNSENVHTLMIYPMCMIPLVFLSQCDAWRRWAPPGRTPGAKRLQALGRAACACLAALLAGRYALLANEAYLCLQINHSRRLSYWNTVVTRIESVPGYTGQCPVVLIRENGWDRSTPGVWNDPEPFNDLVGIRMPIHTHSDTDFLRLYLGFAPEFRDPAEYRDRAEVQEMPLYPHDGSVRLVDGAVVVKF